MIKLFRFPTELPDAGSRLIAAFGTFDGIHRGHQRLLSHALNVGDGATRRALVSLYPHPAFTLKGTIIPRITSLSQSVELLEKAGIDLYYLVHFTAEVSRMNAQSFIRDVLVRRIGITDLIVGPDASIGKGREGGPEFICETFKKLGRSAEMVAGLERDGVKISSRSIREAVLAGNFSLAEELLGRPYVLRSRVARGAGRGSRIGIPTANIMPRGLLIPAIGVYASYVFLNGIRYAAITNVGVRPTFGESVVTVESYLPDYRGDSFYRQRLDVQFVSRLREEMRFPGVSELRAQIARDLEAARRILV